MNLGISDFLGDVKGAFSNSHILGVDIGTTSIKMVEVSKKGGGLVLENYGILETLEYLKRGNAALQTSALKISERTVVPVLETMLREMRPTTKNVIASIPAFNVFYVVIETPQLAPKEVNEALRYQAKQYVPIPLEQVNLEWIKLDDFQNESGQTEQRYLMTAVPIATIEAMKGIFKKVGLKLVSLEIESKALARSLLLRNDPTTQIIDIGSESSALMIADSGIVQRVVQVDMGAATLTRQLARSLDISVFRSENLKRRRGLLGTGGEYEISRALLPFVDQVFDEAERMRNDFERATNKKVRQIILSGGGANLQGIEEHIKERSGLVVKNPDSLALFGMDADLEPVRRSLSRTLATSAGLALGNFS